MDKLILYLMYILIRYLIKDANLTNALATVASSVIALAALLVSAVSLWVGRQALALQHKHNVLSVKPLPIVSVADYEDQLTVRIHNNGTGPAIIKSVAVKDASKTEDSLIKWMPPLPDGMYWDTFTGPLNERIIASGREITLLQFSGDTTDATFRETRDKCRNVLSNLTVVVEYADIYESKFPPQQKSLSWFGRHIATNQKEEVSLPEVE
jgi:hypothetical protein